MSKGGMQTQAITHNYCPVCSGIISVGYGPTINENGIYAHITQKGSILLCDISRNLKRKRIKSAEWQEIMKENNRRYIK